MMILLAVNVLKNINLNNILINLNKYIKIKYSYL